MTLTARLRFLLTRPLRDVTMGQLGIAADHVLFLLTRPLRDVTRDTCRCDTGHQFLLTRPLRDVTKSFRSGLGLLLFLLTRPLRDVTYITGIIFLFKFDFYSHAPYGT